MVKRLKTLLACWFVLTVFGVAYGFEGRLEYRIQSGDREWVMTCWVKGDYLRAEVFLGESHFQTIIHNQEGVLLVDEMNKQIFTVDYERDRWGERRSEIQLASGAYSEIGTLTNRFGQKTTQYRLRGNRRSYVVEVFEGHGSMPGVFLDQFSALRPLGATGIPLFSELSVMPYRIYRERRERQPILELVSLQETQVDDSSFDAPLDYIRAKMRFRMR